MIPLFFAASAALLLVWAFGPQWVFLCRSSLLGLALMYFLPLVGTTLAKGLCIGAFDLKGFGDAFTAGFLFFLACWAVTATSDLVLDLAAKRLDQTLPPVRKSLHTVRSACIAIAFVLNCYAILVAKEAGLSKQMLRITLGLLVGLVAGFVLFAVLQYFDTKTGKEKFRFARLSHRLLKRRESELPKTPLLGESNNQLLWFGIPIPSWLGRGYFEERHGSLKLLRGHRYALFVLAIAIAVYLFFYVGNLFRFLPPPPALCSLLLFLIIFIWLLSGLSFFLDAYRIPLFVSLVAILVISSLIENSDHFYRIWKIDASKVQDPPSVALASDLLSRPTEDEKPAVLIAAAGGGIQAAAWTARVLTGLEEALDGSKPGTFAKSIRLLSGVSGGSVGIMFYVNATYPLNPSEKDPAERRRAIVGTAQDSSLDPTVFALVSYDLERFLFPVFVPDIFRDRGRTLELAWCNNDKAEFQRISHQTLEQKTLNSWVRDIRLKQSPAVIFNSTAVEPGERMTFSTSMFSRPHPDQRDFLTVYPDKDISIPTAVRLSATFPVVSPAARPKLADSSVAWSGTRDQADVDRYHLVDGGYFDNSGLTAVSAWLDDALQDLYGSHPEKVPGKILVIEIKPFPAAAEKKSGGGSQNADTFLHLLAPLLAVNNVRDHIQIGMAEGSFYPAAKRWELEAYNPEPAGKARKTQLPKTTIQLFPVQFQSSLQGSVTPLSWHLRECEKQDIDAA
jgi:Patatin-like phospholipase